VALVTRWPVWVLQEETLRRQRRILGDGHPDALASASILGLVLWSLDDYRQARQLLTDTLIHSRQILGEDHPLTLGGRRPPSPW
jgi:hypothetical protein